MPRLREEGANGGVVKWRGQGARPAAKEAARPPTSASRPGDRHSRKGAAPGWGIISTPLPRLGPAGSLSPSQAILGAAVKGMSLLVGESSVLLCGPGNGSQCANSANPRGTIGLAGRFQSGVARGVG